MAIRYVDSTRALEALSRDLAGHPWIALDTEFIRESTYYPQLCLLQVAAPELTACVDPLALPDLGPLLDVLFDPAVTKVLHACHQDMEIFFHLCGRVPQPIFDTQLAAPFLGLPYQASYSALVMETLGISLGKDHARTDWRRRPLSEDQLQYAIDDVRYLGPMHLQLRDRLVQLGRLEWLADDFAAASDVTRYRNEPHEAWQRIRGAKRLSGSGAALVRALAEWRETVARREDRPRGWILRDDALVDIARTVPTDEAQLSRLRSLPRQTAARRGKELLAIIHRVIDSPPGAGDASTGRAAPLTAAQEDAVDAMMALLRTKGTEHSIQPNSIASRSDLIDLVRGRPDSPLLRGWKRDLVGLDLLRLARGGAVG